MRRRFAADEKTYQEKEKRTLETLLYCPLSLRKIFQAKVLASFLLSMTVSLFSFAAMLLVMETEILAKRSMVIYTILKMRKRIKK